jgi:hypothetical protein
MNPYKLWLHSDKNMNDWSLTSFDIFDINNEKYDLINYQTDKIILENTLYYINSLSYSKNYHITITNFDDYPIQEEYEHSSYYSFTNKFNEYKFWTIIIYCFISKSDIFTNIDDCYGISYSCKHGKFIVKILYRINTELPSIFNKKSVDYKKYIEPFTYNLNYKFKFIN